MYYINHLKLINEQKISFSKLQINLDYILNKILELL